MALREAFCAIIFLKEANVITLKEKTNTVKDYKLLPEGAPYQLIEGELIMTPSPNSLHQMISGNLFEMIRKVAKEKCGGTVLYSPIDVYLDEENVFQPDIVFISKERSAIIKEDGIHGAPDIVIEILSPSTAYYDMKKKFRVYERCGVREYWIVDPGMKGVEIFALTDKGEFALSLKVYEKGTVASAVLTLEIPLQTIFDI